MPLGFRVQEADVYRPQDYLKDIFWAPTELRNERKASVVGGKVLFTLAQRMCQFFAKDLRIKYEPTFLSRA